MSNMDIYRGDIFYVKKGGYNVGSEQEAGRPGVIVSNNINNSHSSTVEVVYLTTQEKPPLPTHVQINSRVPSTALCEQIWSVSVDRLGDWIKECTEEEMAQIDNALMISLGLGADEEELKEAPKKSDEIVILETQRDMYKQQYEALLERLIVR